MNLALERTTHLRLSLLRSMGLQAMRGTVVKAVLIVEVRVNVGVIRMSDEKAR
jgi:hypothetical protein